MIKIGTLGIDMVRIGSIVIDAAYLANEQIWPSTPPLGAYDVRLTLSDSSTSSVTYSNGQIPTLAFDSRSDIIGVEVGDGITTIGMQAFGHCSNLESAYVGSGVTGMTDSQFLGSSGITSVTLNNNVLASSARTNNTTLLNLFGNGNITTFEFGNNVTSLGENALCALDSYMANSSLTSVVLSSGITTIGNSALRNLDGLTEITLPSGVTRLGNNVFYGCNNLTSITCLAATAPALGSSVFSYMPENGTLYVPNNSDYSTWLNNLPSGWTITYI